MNKGHIYYIVDYPEGAFLRSERTRCVEQGRPGKQFKPQAPGGQLVQVVRGRTEEEARLKLERACARRGIIF